MTKYADIEYLGERFEDAELDGSTWRVENPDGSVRMISNGPAVIVLSPIESLPRWRRLAPR